MPDLPAEISPTGDPAADADAARSLRLYQASQTFLLRRPDPRIFWIRALAIAAVIGFMFVGVPLLAMHGDVPVYRVNYLGRYLCYAIVALGIDLIWGYTGLLSLCQALFFALGGYAMAMHLSLPEGGGKYAYPQFMTFAYYGHGMDLPPFWVPFRHVWFAVLAGLLIPTCTAAVFGFFILRSRIRGVYFSIVTQALAAASWLLISRNEMLLGGTNGLTNFFTPTDRQLIGFYVLTLVVLVMAYLACAFLVRSRLGRIMVAVRDKETRLYFAGYKPYAFKVFAFSAAALLAGIGGMLYPLQMNIITPQNMDVEASIVMVVMVAIGGRGRLWGSIFGALLFMVAKSALTTDFASGWTLVEGLIAISVVLFFPDGFAGLWATMEKQVAAGHGLRALLTVVPLLTVAVFVLAEVLGLMPAAMRGETLHPLGLAPKYWLLITVLGLSAWLQSSAGKRMRHVAPARGFDPLPGAESATAVSPVAKHDPASAAPTSVAVGHREGGA